MEIKRQDAIDLYALLKKDYSNVNNTKFAYGIAKNIKALKDEVEILKQMNKVPEDFLKYEAKRHDLCIRMCNKDEDGKCLKKRNHLGMEVYDIEDPEEFDNKIQELQEEYKDAIQEKAQKEIDVVNFLKEKVDLPLYPISIESFPEDLNSETMIILEPIIKE